MVRVKAILICASVTLLLVTACATIEELAPPVNEAMLAALAPRDAASDERIERGREVYVTKCARCHSPERVTHYALARWEEILPRMAQKASLSTEDHAAVEQYITAVLATQKR